MNHAFSTGLMSDYSLENNGHSKLKNYEVSEIKEMLRSGNIKQVDIAKKFNVTV